MRNICTCDKDSTITCILHPKRDVDQELRELIMELDDGDEDRECYIILSEEWAKLINNHDSDQRSV